ncbi:MAG: folate family ECF transporter S component [Thermoclostridium sp.]|nr:folate family ECF transporter S component [Thermoclostridium sp.]
MERKGLFSFMKDVRQLVLVSTFISLYVVLSLFTIYITKELRFSLTFVPIAWSSAAFGPVAGAFTGAFGDVLAWVIKPAGAYHPGFTISGIVSGMIYGLFMYKKPFTWGRVIFASLVYVIVVELGLNTLWLSGLYGTPYSILILTRGWKALGSLIMQVVVLYGTGYYLKHIAPNRIKGV